MSHFTWQKLVLHLRNPFHLSYGVSNTREAFWIRLNDDAGWGEGTIPPYYRVDPGEMLACWERLAGQDRPLPDDLAEVAGWVGSEGPAAARCAVEIALYDRIGKLRGLPLYRLLDLPEPRPMMTSYTVSGSPEEAAREAKEAARFSIIKIKLGSGEDVARVAAVREARPDARLMVDANAGWGLEEALRNVELLAPYRPELIEQPVAKEDIAGMGKVQAATPLPVFADESVQTPEHVERLAEAGVAGINLKLMKLGGLTPTIQIARRAQQLGLRIMLGSMIETSIGATAMAHLIGMAEWLDLDSPLLISNDPFDGLRYDEQAYIHLPGRAGVGVTAKEA